MVLESVTWPDLFASVREVRILAVFLGPSAGGEVFDHGRYLFGRGCSAQSFNVGPGEGADYFRICPPEGSQRAGPAGDHWQCPRSDREPHEYLLP